LTPWTFRHIEAGQDNRLQVNEKGRITFFPNTFSTSEIWESPFSQETEIQENDSFSQQMALGDILSRSATVTELGSRRTCVRTSFYAGTLSRDVH
jgi:hypothetical protein